MIPGMLAQNVFLSVGMKLCEVWTLHSADLNKFMQKAIARPIN